MSIAGKIIVPDATFNRARGFYGSYPWDVVP
jgi:hypothetical protein